MNSPAAQITNTRFVEIAKTYWAWRRLWLGTTIAFAAFGLVYVVFLKHDVWTASQGLIVRDEANGAVMRLGRFQSQTEMKAAQETILEMARNTQVLREALLDIGPAKNLFNFGTISKGWPNQAEVAELAEQAIGVRAPQGAEFGTTEVIYLDIKQHSPERALELNSAVCKALDNRLRQVRMARADGVIGELERAASMANATLLKATESLQLVEREAGPDLSDLRGLSEANGNGNTSRQMLDTVKTELRQLENTHNQLLTDCNMLRDTQTDPEQLLSAPASILNAHPGLKKLREGLADAQLASSQLRGRFTVQHPLVFVATSSEREIKSQLQAELAVALATTEKDVENSTARIVNLKRQQQQLEDRLERLARGRANYDNLNNELRSRTKILQDAERQLAEARASRDAAMSTSLLTRLDQPVLGERPIGPGRSTILGGLTMAGLMFGLGIVFLLTPMDGEVPASARWNEALGRRISDRFPWLADQGSTSGGPSRRRSDLERRRGRQQPVVDPSPAISEQQSPSVRSSISPAEALAEKQTPSSGDMPLPLPLPLPLPTIVAEPILFESGNALDQPQVVNGERDSKINTDIDGAIDSPADHESRDKPVELCPATQSLAEPAIAALAQDEKTHSVLNSTPLDKTLLNQSSLNDSLTKNDLRDSLPTVNQPTINQPSVVESPISIPDTSTKTESATGTAPTRVALNSSVKPLIKPAQVIFRPNQSKPASLPVKPLPARPQTSVSPLLQPPYPRLPEMPAQAIKANSFETPLEGGLAGIGMPTQPSPEGAIFRPQ